MQSIYFGGSRSLVAGSPASFSLAQVTHAALLAGHKIHVGCQFGADQQVISYASQCYSGQFLHALRVFSVLASSSYPFNHHIPAFYRAGGWVHWCAGGQSAPMPARYLLRSIAAFQGCAVAVFFSPGAGSLAVARECVRSGLQVFAFQPTPPASVPSVSGSWVAASFHGFACWQWVAPSQLSLF